MPDTPVRKDNFTSDPANSFEQQLESESFLKKEEEVSLPSVDKQDDLTKDNTSSLKTELDPLIELEIQNLENQKPASIFHNKKISLIVATLVVLIFASVGVLGYVFFAQRQGNLNFGENRQASLVEEKKKIEEKIIIENEDAKILDELKHKLVYGSTDSNTNSNDTGFAKYYSPTINTLLQFSAEKYRIREDFRGVVFSFIDGGFDINNYGKMFVVKKANLDTQILDFLIKENENLNDFEIISKTTDKPGKLHIRFSQPFLAFENSSKFRKKEKIYLIRDFSDQFLIAELIFDQNFDIEPHEKNFIAILSTAIIDPKIDNEIQVVLSDSNLTTTFDRTKWENSFISSNSASFRFLNRDERPEIQYPSTTLGLSTARLFGDHLNQNEEQYFEDIIVKSIKDTYQNKDFTEEGKSRQKIGDIEYFVYSFSYKSFETDKDKTFGCVYLSKLRDDLLLEINLRTKGKDSVGFKESQEIIKNIRFKENISTQSTSEIIQNQFKDKIETTGQVLGTNSVEIDTATILARPATLRIFNKSCVDLKFSTKTPLYGLAGKTETVCSASFGTGFFINKDGYLLSNSHVMTPNKYQVLETSMSIPMNESFWKKYIQELKINNPSLVINELVVLATLFEQENMKVLEMVPNYTNYAGKEIPFEFDTNFNLINPKNYIKLDLIDTKGDSSNTEDIILATFNQLPENLVGTLRKQDIALAKVSKPEYEDYPFIELEDPEIVTLGGSITIIGFPSNAHNTAAYSEQASMIPTITKGTISAIKPNPTNEFKIVQFDASISGGNSGGPVINSSGKVVALATWGLNNKDSAIYNGGTFVEEAQKLILKNNVKINDGKYNDAVKKALSDFSKKDYVSAKSNFEKAVSLYPPALDSLSPLIKISQNKIDRGESIDQATSNSANLSGNESTTTNNTQGESEILAQLPKIIREHRMVVMVGLILFSIVLLLILLLTILMANSKKKKQEQIRLARLQELYRQRQMQIQAQSQMRSLPPQGYQYQQQNFSQINSLR